MNINNESISDEQILEEIKNRKDREQVASREEKKTELVIFKLNTDYYAFYGYDIKEILPYEKVTYVPGCPEFIIGIINVRGDIESVIDIHKLMGLSESQPAKKSRIVIAVRDNIRSGILVDSVEDVVEVPASLIKRPISTLDKSIREFSVGGETLYEHHYVTILDIGKIFSKIVI